MLADSGISNESGLVIISYSGNRPTRQFGHLYITLLTMQKVLKIGFSFVCKFFPLNLEVKCDRPFFRVTRFSIKIYFVQWQLTGFCSWSFLPLGFSAVGLYPFQPLSSRVLEDCNPFSHIHPSLSNAFSGRAYF